MSWQSRATSGTASRMRSIEFCKAYVENSGHPRWVPPQNLGGRAANTGANPARGSAWRFAPRNLPGPLGLHLTSVQTYCSGNPCRRLALGTVLHASAGRQRSPLLHMKAAHAGGPLLAGQHRARRVFATFFFFEGGRCCCSVIGEVQAARVSVRVDRGQ